jgi:ubiquinone/menaquinone biosynthesis C-methylase UbiE
MQLNQTVPFQGSSALKQRAEEYFDAHSQDYSSEHYKGTRRGAKWARHNALLKAIQELQIPGHAKILDLGCGPGFLSRDLCKAGYTGAGLDASRTMIDSCEQDAAAEKIPPSQWQFIAGDAEDLPFADGNFDVIVAAGLIEYMPSDAGILREICRVLKPGGWLMINVTNRRGYTVCLSSISLRIRRLPGVLAIASAIRRMLVGRDVDAQSLNFIPRKHSCSDFQTTLKEHGMPVKKDIYLHFSLLPAPFCTLMSRLTGQVDESLDALDKTFLRKLGSCYIAIGQKV